MLSVQLFYVEQSAQLLLIKKFVFVTETFLIFCAHTRESDIYKFELFILSGLVYFGAAERRDVKVAPLTRD